MRGLAAACARTLRMIVSPSPSRPLEAGTGRVRLRFAIALSGAFLALLPSAAIAGVARTTAETAAGAADAAKQLVGHSGAPQRATSASTPTPRLSAALNPLVDPTALLERSHALNILPSPAGRLHGPLRTATTHIPSTTYSTDTQWTIAGSPYVLDGNVTIATGATLTIDPGVIVKLNGQFETINVNGRLNAVGTATSPIIFTSYQDDSAGGDTNGDGTATSGAPGQWYQISINSSGSQISYATIRDGGYGSNYGYGPITLYGSGYSVALDHDTITNNQQSGVNIGSGSTATITNSTVSGNGYGIFVNNGTVIVDHTTITNNANQGVRFNLPGFSPLPAASSITSSEISGNTTEAVYLGLGGSYPTASQPWGTQNNIYSNNAGGTQLYTSTYPSLRRADVNWRNNYWGNVYYWFGNAGCAGVSPYNAPGHLAYRGASGNVPAGPIDGGTYLYSPSPGVNYWCGYDSFKLDSLDFSPTKFDTAPHASVGQTLTACTGTADAIDPTSCLQDPVNSATGEFTHVENDLSLPGIGVAFSFTRYYNSLDLTKGDLSQGWTDNYNASLKMAVNGDVTLRSGDGQQVQYTKQPDGSFVGGAGTLSTLAAANGGYDLTQKSQIKERFDSSGRLTSIVNRNGQGTTLGYDSSGLLATVTDASGRTATFTHDTNGMLTRISLPDGRTAVYGYTNGALTSFTDARGKTSTYSYDVHGFLQKQIDPLGNAAFTNTYGDDGRVTQQADALGKTTTFAWDPTTGTETVTDPRGNAWKDVYSNNVLIKRVDGQGNQTQYGYDSGLDQTTVTGPSGASVSAAYDSRANELSVTAPPSLGGVSKVFTYDSKNDVLSIRDPLNHTTAATYDTNGNLATLTVAGVTTDQMSYDAKGELTSSTDGRGNTTTYAYDANGNRTSMTDPLGKTTTYTYDGAGRLVSTTDALGHVSTSTYDGAGNVLTRTDPLGKVTQYAYDAAANLTTTTDANGHVTTSTYDAAGRLASTTAPDGGVTSYTYDNAGNQLTVTDALGHVTTSTYDNDNRLASTTSPLGEKTTYTYDADGNLTSAVDPRGNVNGGNPANYTTSHSYDAAGRELTTTDQLGHSTSRTYDSAGRLTSTTDADGHTTAYSYDALGRLLSTTAPDGGITSYSYDGNGNVVSRTDPKNHATTYVYDADNRLTNVTSPLSKTWTTTYNAAGQAITKTSPRGITTTYGLDADGHVTTVNYSDSTPAASYTYDAAGNRLSMNDRAGTVTFAYDSCDRLLRATRGSDTFSYTYDRSGNLLTRTYPDGKVTTYSYDQDGRMASATSSGATTAYTYDPAGDLTQTNLPSSNGYVETRSYDRAARLIDVTNAKAGTALSRFALTVDNVGNPTQVVRSGGISMTSNFAYDANDRLTSVSGTNSPNIAWTYDKAGNRLTETRGGNTTNYTYNADDQLTAAGSTSYSYDADGDNIQAGSRTFSYDGADELTSTSAAGSTTSYTYDGDGNRLSASGGANPATYLWDTNGSLPQLAIERGSNGSELRAYTYGVRRLALTTPSGAFYYHYDNVGSIVNVTSAAGATEWTDAYEPFGTIFTETKNDPNAPANPMHFAAEYKDSTALYNLRARSYDPATGRFLGVDPLSGSADSYPGSLYAYANQNPVRFTDPSGRGPLSATNDFGEMAYAASSGGDAVTVIPWEPQGYALYYPYDRKLVLGRVDAGIDSKIAHQGPIFAIADSHVSKYDPPGTSSWQGLGAIYFTLDKGIPWGGTTYKKWYSAEGGWFTPSLRYVPGPKTPRPMAYAGQVVAYTKSGWQESGFDAGQDKNGDKKSPEGYDFLHFCHLMRRLGHFAPGA